MTRNTSTLMDFRKAGKAFSLVEVVLALGIASLCLAPLVGLLPVGLGVVKTSQEQAAGAVCLNQLTEAIRTAAVQSDGSMKAGGIYNNITWRDQSVSFTMDDVSLGGTRTPDTIRKRLVVHVLIEPPSTNSATGRALVSVAWPNHATWLPSTSTWSNAQGSVSTWLVILPNP